MNANFKKLSVALGILLVFLSISVFSAAGQNKNNSVIIDTPTELGIGSEFDVDFSLNSGERINAFELKISYNPQELGIVLLDDSKSEVDIWAERTPTAPGSVVLKGGFLSPRNGGVKIITTKFVARNTFVGKTLVSTGEGSVFLADGSATRRNLPDSEVAINFSTKEAPKFVALNDNEPPVIENVKVIKDPFDDKNLILAFNARDTASGVKDTFVRFRRGFVWGEWFMISSPAQVPRRAWAFQLRALDNSGNDFFYGGFIARNILGKIPLFLAIFVVFSVICIGYIKIRRRNRQLL